MSVDIEFRRFAAKLQGGVAAEPDSGRCGSCRFNGGSYHDGWEQGLRCRRHSPRASGGIESAPVTMWPLVQPGDWCGDYRTAAP